MSRVEASALTQPLSGTHGRSPLLRLQSDERLIALVRRGNHGAFETLVARYQSRLLAFCRHMLGSREDAEDVLQEVFAAAFNAILADDRPINARPWLYRIARNRSLNHLRRAQPIGVDSMDVHYSEHGATTADKVDKREQFRELIADVQELPETQRTALLLREIDALSYEQIAEAMETTIPSVKSLLVRARVSLAEAAEARLLSCEDVRIELAEIAEGLRRRTTPPVRRHLRACERCATFRTELRATSKALALLLPVGPFLLAKKVLLAHIGLSSVAGAGGTGGAGGAATGTAAVGALAGGAGATGSGGLVSAGLGALGAKAAAGIAAAALVTAGAVEIEHTAPRHASPRSHVVAQQPDRPVVAAVVQPAPARVQRALDAAAAKPPRPADAGDKRRPATTTTQTAPQPTTTTPAPAPAVTAEPGRTQLETSATTLPSTLPATAPPPTLVPVPAPTGAAPATTQPPATSTTPAPPPASTTPVPPSSTSPQPPPIALPPVDDPGTGTGTTPAPPAEAGPDDGTPSPPADER
ncbi:MAG: sigma-70 family RNA polymerase sigma factor [Actinobacteria bacterium]|nr:sigma-70 family RNA polymerase sigma factor [Actinomycetota bacterium]